MLLLVMYCARTIALALSIDELERIVAEQRRVKRRRPHDVTIPSRPFCYRAPLNVIDVLSGAIELWAPLVESRVQDVVRRVISSILGLIRASIDVLYS